MGCLSAYCALCGGPLETGDVWDSLRAPGPEPSGEYWDYNENLVSDEDFYWLPDIRLVGKWRSAADRAQHPEVIANAEVYFSSEADACMGGFEATDRNGVTHWTYAFCSGENEGYDATNHFVMHSACLLICKRWMYEEGQTIESFYDALSVYDANDFQGVRLPNLHYGAEQFWGQFWIAKQRWEFIVIDPVNVPGMTEYILSKLRPVSPQHEHFSGRDITRDGSFSSSTTVSLIEALPAECIRQICAYLPLVSIFSFRRSCRTFASRMPLDQDFYRQALLSGKFFAMQDLDLALVERRWDEIRDKDWRRLVGTLGRYENFEAGESAPQGELHDAPLGLKNRMRIVKVIYGIFTGT